MLTTHITRETLVHGYGAYL
jgi:hypothetical protein